MQTFLAAETDATCKRNAFVFLSHCSLPQAAEWILSVYDSITAFDELLQMSIIEVIRTDCKHDSAHRVSDTSPSLDCYQNHCQARYIRCIFDLLNASSHAVKYEAATTLTTLTQNPAAVKGTFCSLGSGRDF